MDQDKIRSEMNGKCDTFFDEIKELLGREPLSCVETQMGSTFDGLVQGQTQRPCNFKEVKEEIDGFKSIYENAPNDVNERSHDNDNSINTYNKEGNMLAHVLGD